MTSAVYDATQATYSQGPLGQKIGPVRTVCRFMVTYIKTFNGVLPLFLRWSPSEASYDVINMATIIRNCPLIKAIVCVGMVIFIQHKRFF